VHDPCSENTHTFFHHRGIKGSSIIDIAMRDNIKTENLHRASVHDPCSEKTQTFLHYRGIKGSIIIKIAMREYQDIAYYLNECKGNRALKLPVPLAVAFKNS
jgi:oligoribonuclease (3'-5' exoribonuclease)